jgi:hypothetical protein
VLPDQEANVLDFSLHYLAARSLLGYFVNTAFHEYLTFIVGNLARWYRQGLIQSPMEPTPLGTYSMLFDFSAIDIGKISYINGIYFYILACHKGANFRLMHRFEGKEVLYLRGFDFEGSFATGDKIAAGFSTVASSAFNEVVSKDLSPHFAVFKVMSPKDIYWETITAERYFYGRGDFTDIIALARYPFSSIYLNASRWKQDVSNLLDRMDHFIVYVCSITESALWELDQLDTDERRGRVTVVLDEKAIQGYESQIDLQDKLKQDFDDKMIWTKEAPQPRYSVAEVRAKISSKFLVTTPEDFEKNIADHCKRIAASSSRLAPGARETCLDFYFYPALDDAKLKQLRDSSAQLQAHIDACVGEKGINCLPLFLNNLQLRIFMTLLMGEHHETGRTLASYAAVMDAAFDYYTQNVDALSAEGRERHLAALESHIEMARHIGGHMLSFGKSHQFENFSASATADFATAFHTTKPAVAKFFETAHVHLSSSTAAS